VIAPLAVIVFALGFVLGDRRHVARTLRVSLARHVARREALAWLADAPVLAQKPPASAFGGDRVAWDSSRVRIARQAGAGRTSTKSASIRRTGCCCTAACWARSTGWTRRPTS
jgi:hypothetical protein